MPPPVATKWILPKPMAAGTTSSTTRLRDEHTGDATKRIDWVDTCKGLAIAAIVLGHCLHPGSLQRFLYLFHVPIFFFISGFLHRLQPDFHNYFGKRIKRLLLPYVAFLIASAPIFYVELVRHGGSLSQAALDLIWGGNRLVGCCTTFWFITCLFLTEQIGNFVLVRCSTGATVLLGLGSLSLAYLNGSWWPRFSLPLDANVVAGALPFFFLGHLYRRYPQPWFMLFSLPGTSAAAYLAWHAFDISVNMKGAHYGVPLVSFVLSLCCIHMLITVSAALSRPATAVESIGSVGRLSLGIMFLHPLFLASGMTQWLISHNLAVGFAVVLLASYVTSRTLSHYGSTRTIFLGAAGSLGASIAAPISP